MNVTERETEDLARTVTCPTCGAVPRRKCRDAAFRQPVLEYSHQSRLDAARRGRG